MLLGRAAHMHGRLYLHNVTCHTRLASVTDAQRYRQESFCRCYTYTCSTHTACTCCMLLQRSCAAAAVAVHALLLTNTVTCCYCLSQACCCLPKTVVGNVAVGQYWPHGEPNEEKRILHDITVQFCGHMYTQHSIAWCHHVMLELSYNVYHQY